MSGRPFRQQTSRVLSLVALLALSCNENNRSDAKCTPEATNVDADPDCIYAGAGKGPSIVEAACAPVTGKRPDDMDCPTFDAVFDILVDGKKGNCAADACHGNVSSPAVGILLTAGESSLADKEAFYQTLTTVTGSVGRPYVVADNPATMTNEALGSWIICNLASIDGGGFPMPPPNGLYEDGNAGGGGGAGGGGSSSSAATTASTGTGMGGGTVALALPPDIAVVRDWILCGAPPPVDPMPNP